jgi:ribosomal protein S17E
MDKVRRLSQEILQKYPGMFGTDYNANKEQLAKIATVHSKMIRNKLVGKITKAMVSAASAQAEEEGKLAAAAAAAAAGSGATSSGAGGSDPAMTSIETLAIGERGIQAGIEGRATTTSPTEQGT